MLAADRPRIAAKARLNALAALLRRHALFAALLAAAAGLRAVVLFAYRPALLFNGDSYGYLANARDLTPRVWRPLGYPILVRGLLAIDRNLTFVVLAQHLLGLAIGVLVYALARRLGVGPIWASLAAVPVLFDAYQLDIEQFVMTEALFELLVVGALALLVWRERPTLGACLATGGLLAAAGLTRTVGLVLLLPVLAYLVWKRVGPARVAGLVVAFALPLVAYATWFAALHGPFTLTARDGYFLYARIAPFARCTGLRLSAEEQILCDPRPPAQRPGANFYLWRSASPVRLLPGPPQARNVVLQRFAFQVIRHQPLAYVATIAGDVVHYFAPVRSTGRRDEPLGVWQFPPRYPTRRLAGRETRHYGDSVPSADRPLTSFLARYGSVAFTPGPLLAAALVAALLAVASRRGRRREAFLLGLSGLALLVTAAATSMFDYRYLLPALSLLPLAGVLGAKAVALRLAEFRPSLARLGWSRVLGDDA